MSSWILVALVGSVAPSAAPSPAPVWQSDYSVAREMAVQQHKPLAVFVGTGSDGWMKQVSEGSVDSRTLYTLSHDYIVVYADRTTTSGQNLATTLELRNPSALVISDRSGSVQAFSHEGSLGQAELLRTLEKYADPAIRVVTTESSPVYSSNPTNTVTPVAYYSPAPSMNSPVNYAPAPVGYPAPTTCSGPNCPQTYNWAPAYAPAQYAPVTFPTQNCPNGRCPNAR